jgi:hypothetical protein
MGEETRGDNYDVKISRELALRSIDWILSRVKHLHIEKILITIGNDFFNVNSMLNITANGTPQSEDDRWMKTYVEGRRLWVEIIERCLSVAPVHIVGIPGNHDTERAYYLVMRLLAGSIIVTLLHSITDPRRENISNGVTVLSGLRMGIRSEKAREFSED